MTRPQDETSTDRVNETRIADTLEQVWQVRLHKLPHHQHIDCAVVGRDGHVKGLVEIKARTFAWGDYPDVMLSASKVAKAKELFECFNLNTAFVVADRTFDIRFVLIGTGDFVCNFGGRTRNPRDRDDSELIVNIPLDQFTPVTSFGRFAGLERWSSQLINKD